MPGTPRYSGDNATTQCAHPHYKLGDLGKLDERLEAHLDGLRVAGDKGWEAVAEALGEGKPGAIFASGILAFESGNDAWVQCVLEAGVATPEASRGLISAPGWLSIDKASGPIQGPPRFGSAGPQVHRDRREQLPMRRMPSGSVFPNRAGLG